MNKQGSNKGKTENGYGRLGMVGILITVLILLAIMLSRSRALSATVISFQRRDQELDVLLKQEKARTEEIEQLKAYMQTDEYVEQTARERLGLVKDNEIVFEEVS